MYAAVAPRGGYACVSICVRAIYQRDSRSGPSITVLGRGDPWGECARTHHGTVDAH